MKALSGERVLLLNWRDRTHPRAGGAEEFCHEIASRWVDAGCDVTLFTARSRGAPREEMLDGVRVVRRGGVLTVYLFAACYVWLKRRRFAAIVDCQNGIPFFASAFAGSRSSVIGVIFHVHQDQFGMYLPAPLGWIGRLLEGPLSSIVYGTRPIVVISPNTRTAVRQRLGFRGEIYIVPCGHHRSPIERTQRSESPRIVCLGRLVPHKRVELLCRAVPALLERWPDLRVDIVGTGPARQHLERCAHEVGAAEAITFHGFVSEADKGILLGRAWVSVNPSAGEGWGLNVIEAAAQGVPSLAFGVPGLSDSIRDGQTGWLIDEGADLSDGLDRALLQVRGDGHEAWADRCRTWSEMFDWDLSAERLARIVAAERIRVAEGRTGRNDRRRQTDSACRIQIDQRPLHATERTDQLPFRRTDLVEVEGDQLRAVLFGADEHDARTAVRRAGLAHGTISAAVARSVDLLIGPTSRRAVTARRSGRREVPDDA